MKEYKFKINGKDYAVAIGEAEGKMLTVNVNGADYQVELDGDTLAPSGLGMTNKAAGMANQAAGMANQAAGNNGAGAASVTPSEASVSPAAKPAGAGEKVNSPLPGVIVEVSVKEGQAVKAGQKIAVLEAMKMENEISAPKDGIITAIHVNKGDSVLEGAPIASIA